MQYDYLLVSSFEFTCDGKRSLEPQEIIEFCVFKYCVKTQTIEAKFHTFVQPQHPVNDKLSTFCKMLTGISDKQLKQAPNLRTVLFDFDIWLFKEGVYQTRFIFVPFTHFELSHMLPYQCKVMSYHCPAYFYTHINLEELHKAHITKQLTEGIMIRPAVKQIRRRNSESLLNSFGVKQVGRKHCAVDNCTNTINLVKSMQEKSVDFTSRVWKTPLGADGLLVARRDSTDDVLSSGRSTPLDRLS